MIFEASSGLYKLNNLRAFQYGMNRWESTKILLPFYFSVQVTISKTFLGNTLRSTVRQMS